VCDVFTNRDSLISFTFSCRHRQANFISPEMYDLSVQCLEDMRRRFTMRIYGYVVMPEHVHF